MTLDAHVVVDRGVFRLDLRLVADVGAVVAILGPNGAGKTTLLRAIAGLEPAARGVVRVDGALLDEALPDGVVRRTPPEQRPIGVVFQDYLLFPHLSALANVAFGLRARGVPKRVALDAARTWLDRVGLADYADRRPRALSGGQAQRVALARALAVEPRVLLLDEPLAALDAATRLSVRAELRRHLVEFGGVSVVVTHDPIDAMVLADRVVVIEEGAVVQDAPPAEVARAPRTSYVAQLMGLNLMRGVAVGTTVVPDEAAGGVQLASATSATGAVLVAFPPAAVALYPTRPDGSPRNVWQGIVGGVEQHGDIVRVRIDGPVPVIADVTPAAVAELRLDAGVRVWVSVKATELRVYPAASATRDVPILRSSR